MCGISGIYDKNNISDDNISYLINILNLLQHRGKDSCGISYINEQSNTETIKNFGSVRQVFGSNIIKNNIKQCIGHVRYTTSGKGNFNEIQPISNRSLSIVHNGNIPTILGHDTSYIFNILNQSSNIEETLIKINNTIPAAYCLIIMFKQNMYVLRDKYGIRPLSYGFKGSKIIISSETIGLNGCKDITNVKSGEILRIDNNGIKQIYHNSNSIDGICAFELIYLMNPDSIYNDILIKDYRKKLGELLAKKNKLTLDNDFIVIGIPNSGIDSAKAYSKSLNLKYYQSIEKNKKGRTFILKNNTERIKECNKSFTYNYNEIKNKKIIIIDDTIVRGNVIKSIIHNIKKIGVKELHVRIPAPPVIDICQLGIAIHSKEELLLNNKSISDVCTLLSIDSLEYLDISDLSFFPKDSYKQCFGGGIKDDIIYKTELLI